MEERRETEGERERKEGKKERKKVTNDVPRSRGNNIVGLAWVFDNDSEPIIAVEFVAA